MPRERKTEPLSPDHAALALATTLFMRESEPPMRQSDVTGGGLSVKQVGEICRGQANPTYLNLLKLSAGLGRSLGQLMTRVDAIRNASKASASEMS
jgi:transcriptional regulator with XRE-family HTH domain